MTDECPINIEPPCDPPCELEQDCDYDGTSDYEVNSEFETSVYSQISYQNEINVTVQQIPTIEIAYLSNVRSDCPADASVSLNPHILTWYEFVSLFYRSNHAFNVNSTTNQVASSISFLNRTYETTTGESLKFNLAQEVRTAWATKCKNTIDNISPKNNILLNKETFGIRSLKNASYLVSLTLEQAITTLLANGDIAPSDSSSSASVRFVVQYKYCFRPLNTCVLANFVFITDIPCYNNTNLPDDL
jgi:hypothetical protein